jgi:hypothetical protein
MDSDPGMVRLAAVTALTILIVALKLSRVTVPRSVFDVRLVGALIGGSACVVAFVGFRDKTLRAAAVALALCAALVVTGQMIAVEWNASLGTDIYRAHKAAGTALLAGENPYSDAVTFLNGSPFVPPGTVVEGYPYPPVVLITYGLVGVFTDPRLVSAVAWLAVLAWGARAALVRSQVSRSSFAVFLVLATLPEWPLIWFGAWTEPLSLALFLAAALAWRKGAVLSGVLLGLALASKQYFVFLAPLVLLHRDDDWAKRAVTALVTVTVTVLPAVLIDPASFYNATVGNLAAIGFRPDSQSISGLLNAIGIQFELPQWAWLAIGLGAAAGLGLRSKSSSMFVGKAALALGIAFAFGLAFPNYWFLVLSLFAVGTILESEKTAPSPLSA